MVTELPRHTDNDRTADAKQRIYDAYDLRTEGRIVAPLRSSVTDNTGAINFTPIYGSQGDRQVTASQEQPQPITHDYVVGRNQSLWSVARNSLIHEQQLSAQPEHYRRGRHHRNHGPHVDGEQVWHRIKEIVDLNQVQHPELRANPYMLPRGMHITMPGAPELPVTEARPTRPADWRDSRQDNTDRMPIEDGGHLVNAIRREAAHQAHRIGTVGDCARGPRQTLEHFGIKIAPMSAVRQGQMLEQSGLFDKVTSGEVQPGDYGYRHWSARTIRHRGLGDLGDSFIVTDCNRQSWQAANDHMFVVPPAGGYYAPGITFLRPNAKFYAAYEHYKQTGQFTRL